MSGTATVAVTALPIAYNVTGGGGYCAGLPGVHVMLSNSQSGTNYQLYNGTALVGAPIIGTGSALDMGLVSMVGTYTVVASTATLGCQTNMLSSAIVSINPLPADFAVTGGGSYCDGGAGVTIGLGGSATGINYRLFRGSVAVSGVIAGTGAPLSFGTYAIPGTYTVNAANPATGCSVNMLSSASVTINSLPVVFSTAGGGTLCAGGTGVDVTLSGSQSGINYQLYRGTSLVGTPVSGTGSLLHFGLQTAAGSYTVVATNSATGCVLNMAGAANVMVNPLPVIRTVTGGGSYCSGGTGVGVVLSGSEVGVDYQLFNTAAVGAAVHGTGLPINFGLMTVAGGYTVVATNTSTGCIDSMAGTANVTINALPGLFTVTGGGNYCAGGTGVAVGLSGSATGIRYQLYAASPLTAVGSPVNGTNTSVSFGLQTLGATYTVMATDTASGCTRSMTGSTAVTVVPTVVPGVTINSSLGDTVCVGASVTYSALSVNGGTSPSYHWKINGVDASTATNYTYLPVDGDIVSVTMTSSAACPAPDTAIDNMTMVVRANVLPDVLVTATPGDSVCAGTVVNFGTTPIYGGTTPSYSWFVNSSLVASGASFTYTPSNSDVVFCKMTSSYQCVSSATAFSNIHAMVVQSATTPSVTVAVSYGTSVGPLVYNSTFSAVVTGASTVPGYQWLLNGTTITGATSATYVAPKVTNNDVVSCFITVNSSCGTQTALATVTVISANVGVQPVVTLSGDIRLVPNPNKGQFTITGKLSTSDNQDLVMEITDMLGQVVYKANVTAANGDLNERVVLDRSLANGMYILNLRSGSESKVFHMVMEQ
jgi:hypothetical protein